jgi:hypothetical protein
MLPGAATGALVDCLKACGGALDRDLVRRLVAAIGFDPMAPALGCGSSAFGACGSVRRHMQEGSKAGHLLPGAPISHLVVNRVYLIFA